MTKGVQSLSRAFSILDVFTFTEAELTLSEIAKKIDLPISTTSRLLSELSRNGILERKEKLYSPGYKLYYLGSIVASRFNIGDVADSIMKELSEQTGEQVTLNVISNKHRVIISEIKSTHSIRRAINIGEPLPLYAGSGKLLLAYQSKEYIDDYLKTMDLVKIASKTITNANALLDRLQEIRRDGYCCSRSERLDGTVSVSAPIFNKEGKLEASLGVGIIPFVEQSKIDIERIIKLTINAAQRASEKLGYFP